MSLAQTILRRVHRRGPGTVFTAQDFVDLGSRAAVDQALSRLARSKDVHRVARGVYDIPRVHPRIGQIAPAPQRVAEALARQSGGHLQPDGAAAANALGLSTQVPAQPTWLTDKRSRRVVIGRLPVVVRHVDPRSNPFLGTPAGMTISALRYLGRGNVSDDSLSRLSSVLAPADKRRLRRVQPQLPGWMRAAVARVAAA